MTLGLRKPKGKEARWQMVKPRLGIAGKALIKVNYQGVPIITQPRKERKIREHNTDMTETRAASVGEHSRNSKNFLRVTKIYLWRDQQHRPNVPTNPDRSCTYLVLRAHSDETSYE